ncbi:MAG TPA: hypothetical protein VGD77_10130 [Gemmatimonadaceae bacterium]
MRSSLVRFRVPAMVVAAGAVALLSACEDKRVKELNTGMNRDSVITVLSKDAPKNGGADSMPNVYWRETYLIGGKNYEVLYFSEDGEKAKRPPSDTASFEDLTPVVMIENQMVGKGWDYFDSLSTANKIKLKKH